MVMLSIDMPSSCYRCQLFASDGTCCVAGKCNEYINGRQANCPLQEVVDTSSLDVIGEWVEVYDPRLSTSDKLHHIYCSCCNYSPRFTYPRATECPRCHATMKQKDMQLAVN